MTQPPGAPQSRRGVVPLRRLKTNRFRTLAARQADNARRRARYAIERQTQRQIRQGAQIDWDDIREAHDDGMTWQEIDDFLAERNRLATMYANGEAIGDQGRIFWASRDPRLPPSAGYYHGIFG